ncbi:MAG: DUF4115 domain-containing protein, partial [Chloroflexota bacterium]|nr:DUF4115 domain-containing protein [Chloroflexota bacterium]
PSPTASVAPTPTEAVFAPLEEASDTEAGEAAPAQTQAPPRLDETVGAIRVQIVVHQRAYLRVTVDDEVEFDGRVLPGATYAFAGNEEIEILSGNGAGLYVIYNDVELGKLGMFGEVVNVIINVDGLLTPTPTITPTATKTPKTTRTPTPTP